MKLRIATRKSELALAQTRWVAAQIRKNHPDTEIEEVHVVTEGDRILDRPLATIGGKGLFITEVEATLLDGRADLAVHSMKDVPPALADGLGIVCVPEREDPHDVLVSPEGIEIEELMAGAKIGTSSVRRSSQLRVRRPDLEYTTLRGNIHTRLRRLDEGKYAAIVLALAGMKRVGLGSRPHWIIPQELSIPAVGQGALAIEARLADTVIVERLAELEDVATRITVEAERGFQRRLSGSCQTPLAAHATIHDGMLTLDAMVGSLDGRGNLVAGGDRRITAADTAGRVLAAQELGREVAESLLGQGAGELIREAEAAAARGQHNGNGGGSRQKWG